MARHALVVLDGDTYRVPTLTNDQLERVMDTLSDPEVKEHHRPFRLIAIMLEDAEPKPPEKVRCTVDELVPAINSVMAMMGLKDAPNPPVLAAVPKTDAA